MLSQVDDRKGLVKVYWADVRERVAKVEPEFAKIVDELSPGKDYPLYLAYYPYGEMIADTEQPFFPHRDKGVFCLTDGDVPKEVLQDLGYGSTTIPMGMILEKEFEWFISLESETVTIPWEVMKAGTFFPAQIVLKKGYDNYAPNGILNMVSGARSTFMLPHIGRADYHVNLQSEYKVESLAPKSLCDHWFVFKEIANSVIAKSNWRSCILYFSENWVEHFRKDQSWSILRAYWYVKAWQRFEYLRTKTFYEIAFSMIQKKRANLKPNPYLADTARHLFATAIGAAPGYAPATDENMLPLKLIQKAYIDSYGLDRYPPIVMQPTYFDFRENSKPVYYSLQYPSTYVFSPKARKASPTLVEILEIERIMRIFQKELAADGAICSDTILGEAAKLVEFNYFHNKPDRQEIVQMTSKIPKSDTRFYSRENKKFPNDAPFVRGCIRIHR